MHLILALTSQEEGLAAREVEEKRLDLRIVSSAKGLQGEDGGENVGDDEVDEYIESHASSTALHRLEEAILELVVEGLEVVAGPDHSPRRKPLRANPSTRHVESCSRPAYPQLGFEPLVLHILEHELGGGGGDLRESGPLFGEDGEAGARSLVISCVAARKLLVSRSLCSEKREKSATEAHEAKSRALGSNATHLSSTALSLVHSSLHRLPGLRTREDSAAIDGPALTNTEPEEQEVGLGPDRE